jgi:Ca-activated chloride channel family protein
MAILARLLIALAMFACAAPAMAAEQTIIILDGSGSMWGQINGTPKLQIARDTLRTVLTTVPPDTELGLLAYGHREKDNCGDIELLVPPKPDAGPDIIAAADDMSFLGKTPISGAVREAAEILRFTEEKATVILITDGIETCDADPCVLAQDLEERGVDFTAHVVGFGLTEDEGKQVSCLAETTGGEFFLAGDGAELAQAITETVAKVKPEPVAEPEPEPEPEALPAATVEAPSEIPAGSNVTVAWTGPDNVEDYITIVEKGAPEDVYNDYARTSGGSPVELTVPDAVGAYEIRYVLKESRRVLASQDVTLTPVSATVEAPAEIPAGSNVTVAWTGPDNVEDYITIVEKGAPEDVYNDYARTSGGSPAEITVPDAVGAYEIRYVLKQSRRVLASQDVMLTPVSATVEAPAEIPAGSNVTVAWTGPDNVEDYITIVEKGAPEDVYNDYARTSGGSPVELTVPDAVGAYEIRYVLKQSRRVLASQDVTLTPVSASVEILNAPVPGGPIEVAWTGPDNVEDYITIVEKGAPEDVYNDYARTSGGSPAEITVPDAVGAYEIRYVLKQSRRVLASQDVMLTPVSATVEAPAEIPAGSNVTVAWTGPDNVEDYITIVEKGAPEDVYNDYARTSGGSPVELTVPDAVGAYEIRYVLKQSRRVLASQDVTLTPVSASVEILNAPVPGGPIEVAWTGPDNVEDYITIVEKGAPEDVYNDYARTSGGSPVTIDAPDALGDYEVRYVMKQSRRVLASVPVTLADATASLSAPDSVAAGATVNVEWTGPANWEDFIEIVPAGAAADAEPLRETRTSQGSPLAIFAPSSPGEYQIRYKMRATGEVAAEIPIFVE